MRRVRLLLWHLFRRTPLEKAIDETIERSSAAHCKLEWTEYLRLKTEHAELWERAALKRQWAARHGWPEQPWWLKDWRLRQAPRLARMKHERPRFTEWAARKYLRARNYKQQWLKDMVHDRIMTRMCGM